MKRKSPTTALVVLSGGQDSLTCLGLALQNHEKVHAISFRYNQRHAVELECAKLNCAELKVPHLVVDLGLTLTTLVTSALTGPGEVGVPHAHKEGLPSSFVPGRNALFLTLAHAYAQEIRAKFIFTGVCQTDYSGYPDCRLDFINKLGSALNIGYESAIGIITPLMFLDKADTFALAENVGVLDRVISQTHTCYNGDHTTKHEWGHGCGTCPACLLRKAGWEEYQARCARNNGPYTINTPEFFNNIYT